MTTPLGNTTHNEKIQESQQRLSLRNMLGTEVIRHAQAQDTLTPLEEALLNTLLNKGIRTQ